MVRATGRVQHQAGVLRNSKGIGGGEVETLVDVLIIFPQLKPQLMSSLHLQVLKRYTYMDMCQTQMDRDGHAEH